MAFINNPLIASLAGAVGLGHLVPGADPAVNAAPSGAPHSAQNQPTFKDRPFMPRPMNIPGQSRGVSGSGMAPEPGQMDPSTQSNPTVADLLNHFGVHPATEVDPHLFIHNVHAWASHPVMSGVLEGLLSGAANTRGGDTIGENISNVAQGIATTHDQQVEHINSQLQAPYQQAMQTAQLQQAAGAVDAQKAQTRYHNAQADYTDGRLDAAQKIADTNAQLRQSLQDQKIAADKEKQDRTIEANRAIKSLQPTHAADDLWNKTYNGHAAEIANGRPLDQLSDFEKLEAARRANVELNGANSAKAQAQKSVKATQSGGSATASTGAGNRATPYDQAELRQAQQEYEQVRKMTPSQWAARGMKPPKPGSPEMDAALKPYKDRLDKAMAKMPGAPKGSATPSAPQATHRYNPSTGTIEAITQ